MTKRIRHAVNGIDTHLTGAFASVGTAERCDDQLNAIKRNASLDFVVVKPRVLTYLSAVMAVAATNASAHPSLDLRL